MSEFKQWDQLSHAKHYLVFAENIGKHLSIDETALSHGELYTVVTNKSAKGRAGSIVAIVAGTSSEQVIKVLHKIPQRLRNKVEEITLDMVPQIVAIAWESGTRPPPMIWMMRQERCR